MGPHEIHEIVGGILVIAMIALGLMFLFYLVVRADVKESASKPYEPGVGDKVAEFIFNTVVFVGFIGGILAVLAWLEMPWWMVFFV